MAPKERLPACFRKPGWREIRLDIDPSVNPDVIGSILDMSAIASGSIDALWSSHNLEHVHSFEVPRALSEFRRVLKPTGFALITLPDIKAVARRIAEDKLTEPLYTAPAGPITPIDILFGHQASIQHGHVYMAHRTAFTARSLGEAIASAGFTTVRVHEGSRWDLWALATMPETSPNVLQEVASALT